ncbi:MAG: hypothetical protein AB4050_06675 [Synechococcus sp.]
MTINIHIERLVLDGVNISPSQRPFVKAAVEAELGRLLAEGGLATELLGGGAVPRVPGGRIELAPENNPSQLGQQIAQAVYGGIGL